MEPSSPDNRPWPQPLQRLPQPVVWLLQHLYNHNPFYVVSAGLVLFGLQLIFQDRYALDHPHALTFNSWLLLGVMAGYSVLLAATGIAIVRIGGVWDDARTILITLVLLFVSMSVNFDKLVLMGTATLPHLLCVGLAFAIAVSELVIRGIGIRFPALFRIPFYLALALFYLYPVMLFYFLNEMGERDAQRGMQWTLWGIFLFPAAAGLASLSLLPAVWRGPEYLFESRSPWQWPIYPWSLFIVLSVAFILRSYYLTVSFHPWPGLQSGFGVYFLVPFLLCASLVLFEIGRSIRSRFVQKIALLAPLPLVGFTLPGKHYSRAYGDFLDLYMDRLGSPVLLAWWGLVGLTIYGWVRGNRTARNGLPWLVALGSVLGPATVDVESLRFPAVDLLVAATVLFAWEAYRQTSDSLRWFIASVGATATSAVALWDTSFVAYGAFPLHLLLASLTLIATAFDDAFARWARRITPAILATLLLLAFAAAPALPGTLDWMIITYGTLLTTAVWLCWHATPSNATLVAAVFMTALWLTRVTVLAAAALLQLPHAEAILVLIAGALSFLLAVAISTMKMGRRTIGAQAISQSG